MNHPCKDCPRQGCGAYHDKCPKVKEWDKKRDEAATRRRLDAEVENCVINHRIRGKRRR